MNNMFRCHNCGKPQDELFVDHKGKMCCKACMIDLPEKRIKESTLRKQLINRILDYTKVELLNEIFRIKLGIYISAEVDWDVVGGHQAIGIETLPEGVSRDDES